PALALAIAVPAATAAAPVGLLPGQRLDPRLDARLGAAPEAAQATPLGLLDDLVLDVGLIHAQFVEGRFDGLGHGLSGCDDPFHRSCCLCRLSTPLLLSGLRSRGLRPAQPSVAARTAAARRRRPFGGRLGLPVAVAARLAGAALAGLLPGLVQGPPEPPFLGRLG